MKWSRWIKLREEIGNVPIKPGVYQIRVISGNKPLVIIGV